MYVDSDMLFGILSTAASDQTCTSLIFLVEIFMIPVSKVLIIAGIILVAAGLLWQAAGKYLHLGKLPGDIAIERGNFRFYFPIVTCILISIVITLILWLIRFARK